jgi:NTP pyrophosphatase (non-canonical NTP hydrolase)
MDIKVLQKRVIDFRNKRFWKQFHKPKDMALSLTLEAAEVLEHFQWKTEAEVEEYLKKAANKKALAEELCDVLFWILTMTHDLDIDIPKVFEQKMKKNEKKYPVKKSKGKHTKYNKL